MTPDIDLELARIAYEAFNASAKGSFARARPLPFDELPKNVKAAWVAAADAVKTEITRPRVEYEVSENERK